MIKQEFKSLTNLNDNSTKKLCGLINMVNACLRSKESSLKISDEETSKNIIPTKISKIPQKIEKEKKKSNVDSVPPTKTVNLGTDFANKFTQKIQILEIEKGGQLSQWLYQALETYFNNFKNGNGTLIANQQTGEATYKKNTNPNKVAKSDVNVIASFWSPIFKKSEVIKREGSVFLDLDQDLFIALLILVSNLSSYGFSLQSKFKNLLVIDKNNFFRSIK